MGKDTKIEWCHHTFNHVRGCTKVSAGCANCFAETMSKRNPKTLGIWGPNGTRVVASEAMWREPLKWNKSAKAAVEQYGRLISDPNYTTTEAYANGFRWTKPERPRVFCASLADVFEDWRGLMVDPIGHVVKVQRDTGVFYSNTLTEGPDLASMVDVRRRLFNLINVTPNLDWLLLTKRPENVMSMLIDAGRGFQDLPDHIWLGTSVEDQATYDARTEHIAKVPAKVRFLSVEPLLGPIKMKPEWLGNRTSYHLSMSVAGALRNKDFKGFRHVDGREMTKREAEERLKELQFRGVKVIQVGDECNNFSDQTGCPGHKQPGIDWVIVGGESGPDARGCKVEWIRDIVHQCKDAGVPVFVKQLGKHVQANSCQCGRNSSGQWKGPSVCFNCDGFMRLRDPKGGDWDEWPEDLRVREVPS